MLTILASFDFKDIQHFSNTFHFGFLIRNFKPSPSKIVQWSLMFFQFCVIIIYLILLNYSRSNTSGNPRQESALHTERFSHLCPKVIPSEFRSWVMVRMCEVGVVVIPFESHIPHDVRHMFRDYRGRISMLKSTYKGFVSRAIGEGLLYSNRRN